MSTVGSGTARGIPNHCGDETVRITGKRSNEIDKLVATRWQGD